MFKGIDRIMYREVTGRTVLCLAAILLCVSVARADYEEGLKAWNAGRPAEALVEWRNAAEAEDRRAMLRLGRLYLQGLGAPQAGPGRSAGLRSGAHVVQPVGESRRGRSLEGAGCAGREDDAAADCVDARTGSRMATGSRKRATQKRGRPAFHGLVSNDGSAAAARDP